MAFYVTETSRGPGSFHEVPSKLGARHGSQKFSGPSAFSASTPRKPGADSWRLGTVAADHFESPTRQSTPMRSRKTAAGPPGWMIFEAAPQTFDASASHMRAHIQSLANLDKEVLAEKLFQSKVQVSQLMTENKKVHVYSRRLEADMARNEMRMISSDRTLSPAAAGERRAQSDIVRNLKGKNRTLRQERNKALAMVAKLQKTVRIAYVHELEAEVRVLQEEVANQQALATGAREKLRMAVANGTPPVPTRFGSRPPTSPVPDGRRRLADVMQELQGARRTLEREAQRLEDVCSHVSTAEAAGKPEMQTALKVIAFLQEHTLKMVERLSKVPQSETMISSLGDLGVVAPASTSATPSTTQLDSLQLPSTLTALAAPLAAAVARVEALTPGEVEHNAWLHDTIVNFAVIAQKFLDVSSALQVTPDTTCVAASHSGEAPAAAAAGGAPMGTAGAEGRPSVDMSQALGPRTQSTADGYDSSAAASSDGSIAEGSVSVNHNLSGLSAGGDTPASVPGSMVQPADHVHVSGSERDDAPVSISRRGEPEPACIQGDMVDGTQHAERAASSVVEESVETYASVPSNVESALSGAGDAAAHAAGDGSGMADDGPAPTVSVAMTVSDAAVTVGDPVEVPASLSGSERACASMAQAEAEEDADAVGVDKAVAGGSSAMGAGSGESRPSATMGGGPEREEPMESEGMSTFGTDHAAINTESPDTAVEGGEALETPVDMDVALDDAAEADCVTEPQLNSHVDREVEDGEMPELEEGETIAETASQKQTEDAEDDQAHAEGNAWAKQEEIELMVEDVPPPLEMPELLADTGEDLVRGGPEEALAEPCVQAPNEHLVDDVPETDAVADGTGKDGHSVDSAANREQQSGVNQASAAGQLTAEFGSDVGGRVTRDSEAAEAMVDEMLEETLASMLSAEARQFAQ
eukprot:jgi/Ulvmu1/3410/UM016_0028.1